MRTIEEATIHTLRLFPDFGMFLKVNDLTNIEYISIISFHKNNEIIAVETSAHIEQLKADLSVEKIVLTTDINKSYAHIPLMFLGCEYLLVSGQYESYKKESNIIMQYIQEMRNR